MALEGKVDTIVFPTWWLDELPFLQASAIQAGFAAGHKVNLVAANIHNVAVSIAHSFCRCRFKLSLSQLGARGSGIYSGAFGDFETINDFDSKTQLLVANLPISPSNGHRCETNATRHTLEQSRPQR